MPNYTRTKRDKIGPNGVAMIDLDSGELESDSKNA